MSSSLRPLFVGYVFARLAANENSYSLRMGIKISRTLLQGEHAIQLNDVPAGEVSRLRDLGVSTVLQNYRPKHFIPIAGENSKDVLKGVLKAYPPQSDRGGAIEFKDPEPEAPAPRHPVVRNPGEAGFLAADLVPTLFNGLISRLRGNPGRASQAPTHITFSDPAVEARFQDAGKPQDEPKGMMEEFHEALKGWTRVYQHLPRKEFGRLIFEMKKLEKARGLASGIALIDMVRQVAGMTRDEYELFRKTVIADDLMETLEIFKNQGATIPDELAFGFTPEKLKAEHARMKAAVAANPRVSKAMEHRERVWNRIKAEYVEAMAEAGEDVSGKLKRENYYRHRVLMQKRLEMLAGGIKTPTGRSFLKGRTSQAMSRDYQTNFIETEMQVMTQLMLDTRTAKFVAYLDQEHNIIRDLKAKAKWQNVKSVMPYFEELAQRENDTRMASGSGERVTGDDMFRRTLNRDQAIAIDTLGRLASKDQLPDTPDGKWQDTIAALADNYLQGKADEEEGAITSGFNEIPGILGYAAWVIKNSGKAGKASQAAGLLFKGIRGKQEAIKRIAGDEFVTWENLIPDTHDKYKIDPTKAFYSVFSIPEHLGMQLMEDSAKEIGITADDVRKVFAMGAERDPMILPKPVVKQFEAMEAERVDKRKKDTIVRAAARATMGAYKRYLLLAPQRVIKYLFRNQTGDVDSAIAGLPWGKSFKKIKDMAGPYQAEIADYFAPILKGDKAIGDVKLSPELEKFMNFGAFEGMLAISEIGNTIVPDVLKEFSAWEKKEPPPSFMAKHGPAAINRGYWRRAEVINNWREAANRYAVYRVFLDEIRDNKGKPRSYSASVKEEVDALPTAEEKAYRMSNDLMGAYDEVSQAGQVLRKYAIPFWSYQELNFRRYFRLINNGIREGTTAKSIGKVAIGNALRAPYFAYKTGATAFKIYALWGMAMALASLFDDDDRKLRKDVRLRPHLTFGHTPDGTEVLHFPRIGNINDIMEWVDLDEARDSVAAAWEGRKPWHGAVWDILRGGPGEKMFLSVGHHLKYPLEAMTGRTYYPNVDRPRAIENWGEKIAQDAGFGDAFRAATGRPRRQDSPLQRVADLLVYRSDPGESSYYDTLDLKRSFLKKRGVPDNEFTSNRPTTEALRNMKKAMRYGDRAAEDKYLMQYLELGGTEKGLAASIKSMHPLAGLNKETQEDFFDSLTTEDKRRLAMALEYYDSIFAGGSR